MLFTQRTRPRRSRATPRSMLLRDSRPSRITPIQVGTGVGVRYLENSSETSLYDIAPNFVATEKTSYTVRSQSKCLPNCLERSPGKKSKYLPRQAHRQQCVQTRPRDETAQHNSTPLNTSTAPERNKKPPSAPLHRRCASRRCPLPARALTVFCCSSVRLTDALLTCQDSRSSRRISARNGSNDSRLDISAPLMETIVGAMMPCARQQATNGRESL